MSLHTPAARNTDPDTSHEAAAALTASGKRAYQQEQTRLAVERFPGLTSLELSRRAKLDRHLLARRLPELEEAKLVRRGEARRCTVSGRGLRAVTWFPPEAPIQTELPL